MIEFLVKVSFVVMLPFAFLSIGYDIGKSYINYMMEINNE